MAINKISSLALGSIAKVNSLAKASMAKINSVAAPVSFTYANNYSVAKSIATGPSNYIRATTPADSPVNFTQTDAFTVSFWVKAGWDVNLNTTVFFFVMSPTDATTNWDNLILLRYKENQNRIIFRMLNNPGAGNYDIEAQWYLHGGTVTGHGLGNTYWSATNRGNVGDNDFTMITVVKTTSTSGNDVRVYWNENDFGMAPLRYDSSSSSMGMVSDEARELAIGSNTQPTHATNPYYRSGNSVETQFNDFAIWDVALDADAITTIFNEGTPIDLTSDSGNYNNSANLQVYYPFENSGDNQGVESDVTAVTVSGDSNFESI